MVPATGICERQLLGWASSSTILTPLPVGSHEHLNSTRPSMLRP
jgi:hypothetical protein